MGSIPSSPRRRRGGGRGRSAAAWQGEEKTQREAKAAEEVGRDACEASASRRWPLAGPRRRAALNSGSGEKQSKQAGWRKEKGDLFAISEIPGTPL